MKALKNKIFDVLTDRVSITKFENWLYDSEEIIENLAENSLYFEVITINYKDNYWRTSLESILLNEFSVEFIEIVKIKKYCTAIVKAKNVDEIYYVLSLVTKNFNYETFYSILWKLYSLKDYFDFVKEGLITIGSLFEESKFYANEALEIIRNGKSIENISKELESNLKEFVC